MRHTLDKINRKIHAKKLDGGVEAKEMDERKELSIKTTVKDNVNDTITVEV